MAATLTPSKITDFFPPSPKVDVGEDTQEINSDRTDKHEDTEKKEDSYNLLTSSLVMTPKSSPVKEEDTGSCKDDTETPTEQKQDKETTCKKSLNETLKKEVEESKPSKQKKKRNRRKNNKETKLQEAPVDVISNGPAKPKSARKKNTDTVQKNKLVTDFFPVRRSERKSKTVIEKEKTEDLQYKILNKVEDGLEVVDIENKGRGVVATKNFMRNDFVVEYAGDLINLTEAKQREDKYGKDPTKGCYMYYFNFKGKSYCIDATAESGKLGRLLNHSRTSGNCYTKLIDVCGDPYLILAAARDIKSGEELLYDYGDRSKAALESHPWLKA